MMVCQAVCPSDACAMLYLGMLYVVQHTAYVGVLDGVRGICVRCVTLSAAVCTVLAW